MRKIGDASFFRIVDRLLASGTGRTPAMHWSIDGVDWQRERHSHAGASHGFTLEVTRGTKAARPGWTLVVVKEYWRAGSGESMKSLQWAHIEAGRRADVVAWLERQERKLESA
ncbi:MAG: hypothetical protein HYZ40_11845 [Rhodospirillales bacterium]|nr:hypothetical protein [Rhodospirillales bacterium]